MARGEQTSNPKTGVAGWNESEGTGRSSSSGGRVKKSVVDRRRRLASVIIVCLLCIGCIVFAMPVQERITRGLWFKGGTSTTLTSQNDVSSEDMSKSLSIINERLGKVGVSEYTAEASGNNGVAIKLPWNCEGQHIAETVGGAGKLEFVRVDEIGDADALVLLNSGKQDAVLKEGTYTAFLDGSHVTKSSTVLVGDGVYAVTIEFDEEGAKKFAEVTEDLAKEYGSIAIVVDGKVLSSPSVTEKIEGGTVSISGDFSAQEAGAIKAVLDTQTLPVNFTPASTEEIGALAGSTVVYAIPAVAVVALVAITVMAFVRMRKLGILVGATLLVMASLMLGCMAIASRIEVYVLSIASLLGGAFACGCGVACAWMIASHFRRAVQSGKSVRGSSLSVAGETLGPLAAPLIIVSVASLVVLFLPFATLRDVGLSVALGIISSIVAVMLFQVPLLRVLATGKMQDNLAAWGLEPQEENKEGVLEEKNQ